MAADFGTRTLRVFAAWPGVTLSDSGGRYDIAQNVWEAAHAHCDPQQIWAWCREGLQEAARWAADAGVTLALQNHPPVIDSPEAMLRMIREVGSPALKACFDAPLARKQGVQSMTSAARLVGPLQVLTHFGGEYEETPGEGISGWVRNRDGSLTREDFYADFAEGMREIGYAGYTGYELCHPLPKVDGVTVGLDFVDRNARLAAEYMRRIIANAARQTARLGPQ
jgi:sugar phosphate isomerase/epimerase